MTKRNNDQLAYQIGKIGVMLREESKNSKERGPLLLEEKQSGPVSTWFYLVVCECTECIVETNLRISHQNRIWQVNSLIDHVNVDGSTEVSRWCTVGAKRLRRSNENTVFFGQTNKTLSFIMTLSSPSVAFCIPNLSHRWFQGRGCLMFEMFLLKELSRLTSELRSQQVHKQFSLQYGIPATYFYPD